MAIIGRSIVFVIFLAASWFIAGLDIAGYVADLADTKPEKKVSHQGGEVPMIKQSSA